MKLLLLPYLTVNLLLATLLFNILGIAGLISWGFGFFLVTGATYLYFEGKDRK